MEDIYEMRLNQLKEEFPEYDENREEFEKKNKTTYELMKYLESIVEEKMDQEFIEKNEVENYDLKKHFSLLTEEEIQRQKVVNTLNAKSFGLSYDTYVEMQNRNKKFFGDVKVLLTYDYPYYSAYKIGNSIEDSEYIECSLYYNDIYKIISIFLETGEKVHDV